MSHFLNLNKRTDIDLFIGSCCLLSFVKVTIIEIKCQRALAIAL